MVFWKIGVIYIFFRFFKNIFIFAARCENLIILYLYCYYLIIPVGFFDWFFFSSFLRFRIFNHFTNPAKIFLFFKEWNKVYIVFSSWFFSIFDRFLLILLCVFVSLDSTYLYPVHLSFIKFVHFDSFFPSERPKMNYFLWSHWIWSQIQSVIDVISTNSDVSRWGLGTFFNDYFCIRGRKRKKRKYWRKFAKFTWVIKTFAFVRKSNLSGGWAHFTFFNRGLNFSGFYFWCLEFHLLFLFTKFDFFIWV